MRIKTYETTGRKLFFVRHGERIDNIMPEWRETASRWDDPYLSNRGHQQAREVGAFLEKSGTRVDRIFTSPFTRCIQTMNGILSGLSDIPEICVEPGLSESLNACAKPPGRPSLHEILALCPFTINTDYSPVLTELPAEIGGDEGCAGRVHQTLHSIIQRFPQGNLLFVSHGSPTASAHQSLFGDWGYVGQCTLGEVLERDGKFELLKWGDSSHLSDKTNLRDVQSGENRHPKAIKVTA
ncbi:unnamed protein product, partial [Mesorhabditis belari]|uniref:Phosphoglycerate mutase n=1 Tax=Mesorhabditis belari TaxID=2138241 RepID=A0AAF3J311_9BILA